MISCPPTPTRTISALFQITTSSPTAAKISFPFAANALVWSNCDVRYYINPPLDRFGCFNIVCTECGAATILKSAPRTSWMHEEPAVRCNCAYMAAGWINVISNSRTKYLEYKLIVSSKESPAMHVQYWQQGKFLCPKYWPPLGLHRRCWQVQSYGSARKDLRFWWYRLHWFLMRTMHATSTFSSGRHRVVRRERENEGFIKIMAQWMKVIAKRQKLG